MISVFGIRHHGPGSARSLVEALDAMQPDVVLIEGPPDADALIPLAAHADMRPPVALLVYQPDTPRQCVYYPFAVFSPEWQAILWAIAHNVPARFMDLPQSIQMAIPENSDQSDPTDPSDSALPIPGDTMAMNAMARWPAAGLRSDVAPAADFRRDPLRALGEAAGYGDGERWWDHMVEQRTDSTDVFQAILEAMTALRAAAGDDPLDPREPLREAFMRQTIRAAQKEGHERIAVVCGAWHAPALTDPGPAKADKALLDKLPKVKTAASWIPWTNSRLSYTTGYGAGIESPGWYHHLWIYNQPHSVAAEPHHESPVDPTPQGPFSLDGLRTLDTPLPARDERGGRGAGGEGYAGEGLGVRALGPVIPWLTRVAHLLREQDLDASPASIIEAVRLSECLAALRGRPIPGLVELNEATQTVLCFGSDVPMRLIAQKLIVGETLGDVPEDSPSVPLQQDLQRTQKRLRLPAEATMRAIDLDLRKSGDLERSELLHRLALLGIPWGKPERSSGGKGTFHELWRLQWQPEFSIGLIEKGVWGNTVADAAGEFARDRTEKAENLPELTRLLEAVMLARLPDAVRHLMTRLEELSAKAGDIAHLMAALPPLVNVLRYGDVRGTDTSMVAHTVDGLIARICIGLPPGCASLDDDAAVAMSEQIAAVHGAIAVLQNGGHKAQWEDTLVRLTDRPGLHGRIGGHCTRLLLDAGVFTPDEAGRHMGLALNPAVPPEQAAAWVEGFLMGSGLLLIHDQALWQILDDWVSGLTDDAFLTLVPLLRRSFSTFTPPERRQLGERAAAGRTRATAVDDDDLIDHQRAAAALPYAMLLLGITNVSGAMLIALDEHADTFRPTYDEPT